jgi:hypothetical protein
MRYVACPSLNEAAFLILFLASFLKFCALPMRPASVPKDRSLKPRVFTSSNENQSLSWLS